MAVVSPIIVKLGGSLGESGRLLPILKIVAAARRPCIIVPGGGAFADVVRDAQEEFRFPNGVAHRMALLAMQQTGMMLSALGRRLQPEETLAGLRAAIAAQRIGVWMPYRLAVKDTALPASWSVTSDALAARLAERMGRLPVVLVKSCRVPSNDSALQLAERGIIDKVFPVIVERARLSWHVLGTGDTERLVELLHSRRTSPRRRPGGRAIARLVQRRSRRAR
jgi:aspartokinase-like uncharacterized kinase